MGDQKVNPAVHLCLTKSLRTPAGKFRDTATGLTHLVEFLKPWGILCKPLPCSPADEHLQRFDNYLQRVRGLAQNTRHAYAHYLRRFLKDFFGEAAPDWSTLTASRICQFVQTEIERTPGGKGHVVSSLRTYLRFLVTEGQISASLVRAIPRVRRWYDATLPRPLSADELENVLTACQSPWGGTRRERALILLLARLRLHHRTGHTARPPRNQLQKCRRRKRSCVALDRCSRLPHDLLRLPRRFR